jgi:hypothetical protein
MLTCNLFEKIHNSWLQQSKKKNKDFFYAIVDDLIRVLEQQTCYKMHLMGKLRGARPYRTQLRLKVAHIFGDPKKITHAIANIVSSNLMDSRSIGSKGEERFKSCKKKRNTMIGFFQDSNQPDNVNFFVP